MFTTETKYPPTPPYHVRDWIGRHDVINLGGITMIKKLLMTSLATTFAMAALAQVEPAVKETAKAASESTKEAGDNAKAAVSSQPDKSVDKAKAHIHKAKAHVHRHQAKKAADAAVH
jgi:hypothetical protein